MPLSARRWPRGLDVEESGTNLSKDLRALAWILMKILLDLDTIVIIKSDRKFAHVTTAQLSCQVQKCDLIYVNIFHIRKQLNLCKMWIMISKTLCDMVHCKSSVVSSPFIRLSIRDIIILCVGVSVNKLQHLHIYMYWTIRNGNSKILLSAYGQT